MLELNRLNPVSLEVNKNHILGNLDFFADVHKNLFSVSFAFEETEKLCPLKVTIQVEENSYQILCTCLFPGKKTVSSSIFHPDFKITKGIKFLNVESFVENYQ